MTNRHHAEVDFGAIAALPLRIRAALVERLIESIDAEAGDADLEDSETSSHMVDARGRFLSAGRLTLAAATGFGDDDAEEDDDAGDTLDQHGEMDEAGIVPCYAIDQSLGPITNAARWL